MVVVIECAQLRVFPNQIHNVIIARNRSSCFRAERGRRTLYSFALGGAGFSVIGQGDEISLGNLSLDARNSGIIGADVIQFPFRFAQTLVR